ncbi:hypothetical protein [Rossellomorea sp. LJF3]|uniref:hypothetical protein n=1 Tax=Rossellomorea sp. LJF3 TaxID=3126099 RepID=UPI00300D486B
MEWKTKKRLWFYIKMTPTSIAVVASVEIIFLNQGYWMGSFIVSARNAGKPKSYRGDGKGKPVEAGFPFLSIC